MLLRLHSISSSLLEAGVPFLPQLLKTIIYIIYHCILPPECHIGKGTKFWHSGLGVVIHPETTIGRNCNVYNHVVIGGGYDGPGGPPVKINIGDNVNLGAGSKILCKKPPMIIGPNSTIGANAVVLNDVPSNAIVGGIPGKILGYKKMRIKKTNES